MAYLWYYLTYFLILLHLQNKNTFFKGSENFLHKKRKSGQKVFFSICRYIFVVWNEQSIGIYFRPYFQISLLFWNWGSNNAEDNKSQSSCSYFDFESPSFVLLKTVNQTQQKLLLLLLTFQFNRYDIHFQFWTWM